MAYIGNIIAGSSTLLSADNKIAGRFQASASFTATAMTFYAESGFGSGEYVRLGIYADSSGDPGALLGYTAPIQGQGVTGLYTAELISGVSITNGSYYWLGIIADSLIEYSSVSTGGTSATNADTYSDGFADPFGSYTSDTKVLTIFATDTRAIRTGALTKGGAVFEASDGTKLALFTNPANTVLYLYSDIDGTPTLEDSATASDIFGGNVIFGLDAAIDSNDDIHVVAACSYEQTRDIAYCKATLSGGSWTFGTWEEVASYTQQVPVNCGCAISLRTSNYPFVFFVDAVKVGGATRDNVYLTYNTTGSWSTPEQVGVRETKTDEYCSPEVTLRNNNYVECWYHSVIGTHRAAWRAYTGTWGDETIYTNTNFDNYKHTVLSDTSGNVYRIGSDQITPYYIYENDTSTGYAFHTGYPGTSACYIDSTRYIFYIDTNWDVHVISNSGSGWTDEGASETGTYYYVVAEWAYNYENQSNEINYIFQDSVGYIWYSSFALGAAAQNITGAGAIASAEAFGNPTVYREQFITGAGNIASAETFGTAEVTVVGGAQNITNAGAISSAETFGAAQLDINITTAGNIGTAEAFGAAQFDLNITSAGNITSAEAFGAAQLDLNITAVGAIASAETFGSPTVYEEQFISGAGAITSAEAFGTAQLDLKITSAGNIASAEAFGTSQLNLNVTTTGIASIEVFGSPTLALNIAAVGDIASTEAFGIPNVYEEQFISGAGNIGSLEAFGTVQLDLNVTGAGGIASVEAFGTAQLDLNITTTGIISAEAFGNANVSVGGGPQNITAAGDITSAEAFGTPKVYKEQFITGAGAITSAETFGTAQLKLNIAGTGAITSAEAFGTLKVYKEQFIAGAGAITSAEAFGTAQLELNITGTGAIASAEAFGTLKVYKEQFIAGAGAITSAEAFGTARLDLNITTSGITSAEAFGTSKVYKEQFITGAGAITSAETFGTAQLELNITAAGGVASAEAFGTPALEYDQDITNVGAIASAEAFGNATVSAGAAPQNITNAGAIGSAEAFGTAQLDLNITTSGITSAEVFGTAQLDLNITGVGGITSLEALGTPQIDLNIAGVGDIASAEAFGTPTVYEEQFISSAGAIISLEAFGTAQLDLYVVAAGGIATGELFGGPLLSIGIDVAGILSAEAFGTPDLSLNIAGAGAITSTEVFGTSLLRGVIRPNSDISLERWTDQDGNTSDLYDTINEKYANDTDYVKSDVTSVASALEMGLSDVNDPGIHTNHTVFYRYKKVDSQSITAQLKVTLLQGSTTIASWTHPNVGAAWADAEQTLTEGQAANITNYNDLRLEFEVVEV